MEDRYGPLDADSTRQRLQAVASQLATENSPNRLAVLEPSDCPSEPDAVGAVLLTPLMERAHRLVPEAGQIGFVDSTFNLFQESGSQVYFLYTNSKCGGLPLGALLTTSKSQPFIAALLSKYRRILPDGAFAGKGRDLGPRVFMMDDETALHGALSQVRV